MTDRKEHLAVVNKPVKQTITSSFCDSLSAIHWLCPRLNYKSIDKEAGNMVGSFYHSWRYLTLLLYFTRVRLDQKTTYYCHVCTEASQTTISSFDRVQICLYSLIRKGVFSILQPLSHHRKVASLLLLYCYFYGICSFVLPV